MLLFCALKLAAIRVLQQSECVYLRVDEADVGFRADVLLVAGGGRGVEAQHGFMRVCHLNKKKKKKEKEEVKLTYKSKTIICL